MYGSIAMVQLAIGGDDHSLARLCREDGLGKSARQATTARLATASSHGSEVMKGGVFWLAGACPVVDQRGAAAATASSPSGLSQSWRGPCSGVSAAASHALPIAAEVGRGRPAEGSDSSARGWSARRRRHCRWPGQRCLAEGPEQRLRGMRVSERNDPIRKGRPGVVEEVARRCSGRLPTTAR